MWHRLYRAEQASHRPAVPSPLLPEQVYDVRVVRDTGTLPALIAKHRTLERKLAGLEAKAAKLEGPPTGKLAKKIDAATEAKRKVLEDSSRTPPAPAHRRTEDPVWVACTSHMHLCDHVP